MRRVGQRILAGNIEFIKSDIMQKHIDAAEVIGRDVDLLPVKAIADGVLAKHLFGFQQQRTRPACRVIDLVDLGFPDRAKPRQKLGNIGRREKFAARLARIGGVHGHQIFISIAECVNVVILHVAKVHICHADEQFAELFIPLCHRCAQFVAIDVEVVKQSRKLPLGFGAFRGFLDMAENGLQRFVEVFVRLTTGKNIAKQLARQDEKALFLHQALTRRFRLRVGHFGVVKTVIARLDLAFAYVICKVFGYVTIEHRTEDVIFEVPSVHSAAQFIRNRPYRAVKLVALLFFLCINHGFVLRPVLCV